MVDLLGHRHKDLVDIDASLGTDLLEDHVMTEGELLGLASSDLSLGLEVDLGAEEDLANILITGGLDLLNPFG